MATEFLHQKWKAIFVANDLNKDGFITLEDANLFADRFSHHHNMSDEQSKELKQAYREFWKAMFLYEEDKMFPDTYITMMDQEYTKNYKAFCERMRRILTKCCNLFDVNQDGYISREEFVIAMKCWGIDALGRKFISSFPQCKPGFITIGVFIDAWVDFFTNDDRSKINKETPVLQNLGLISSS